MDESDQVTISLTNENIPDTSAVIVDRVLSKTKQKLISFPKCWSKGCRPEHRTCDCSWSNCRNICLNYKQCQVHDSKIKPTPSAEFCRLPSSSAGLMEMTKPELKESPSKKPESEIFNSP